MGMKKSEVAEFLGVTEKAVENYVNRGQLKVGRG
jgi:predicted transcriptional regulator